MLSNQFCQAAVLALRDCAIEFETAYHVLYVYSPTNERIDEYGYFMYSVYNEVGWHRIAEKISKLSSLYIPFYAQARGLDPEKLSDEDARRIFLYMMIVELEEGCRIFTVDYETGFGYEGVLYALYVMGEEKPLQVLAALHPEIRIWALDWDKPEPIEFADMLSLKNLEISFDEQVPVIRAMMLNYLFGNLLRESLLSGGKRIAHKACGIRWEEVICDEIVEKLIYFVTENPNFYENPNSACDAFFTALSAVPNSAPLMQLVDRVKADTLKSQMLSLLPSYITYFERQSYSLFADCCDNYQPPSVCPDSA